MEIKILQIKEVSKCDYVFMSYSYAVKKGGVKLKDYATVYEFKTHTDLSDTEVLDKVYFDFNTNRPCLYTGRSVSVSDIIVINDNYYYCDSCGWKHL